MLGNSTAAQAEPPPPAAYVAPRNRLENELQAIWQEVLGVAPISVEADFFLLGGHSLSAMRIANRLRQHYHSTLPLAQLFRQPTIAALADWLQQQPPASPALPPISKAAVQPHYPLSWAQQRLWSLGRLQPDSPAYNIPLALDLYGLLDRPALASALQQLWQRHDSLRTRIVIVDGEPRQFVDGAPPELLCQPATEAEAAELQRQEALAPFAGDGQPLARLKLLAIGPQHHRLLITLHHLVCDAGSLAILAGELAVLYPAARRQQPPMLAAPALQYTDYSIWQQQLPAEQLDRQLRWWQDYLHGAPQLIGLPLDYPRPPRQSLQGARHRFTVSHEIAARLRTLASQQHASLFMLLLASYQLWLSLLCRQNDVCVGIPRDGRFDRQLENTVGFFVNALVIRTDISANPRFDQLLEQVREHVLQAFAHEQLPAEQVMQALQLPRSLQYTPIIQAAFNLAQADNTQAMPDLDGLRIELLENPDSSAKFELLLTVSDSGDALACEFEYNSALFDAATIHHFAEQWTWLLQQLADDAGTSKYQLQLPPQPPQSQPLTPMQRDLYLASLARPHSLQNSIGYALELPIALDTGIWQQSLQALHQHYCMLRARLANDNAVLPALVFDSPPPLEIIDLRDQAMDDAALQQYLRQLVVKPYRLPGDALQRQYLLQLGEQRWYTVLACHHLLLDGMSFTLHAYYLVSHYFCLLRGEALQFAPDNYRQFVAQQLASVDQPPAIATWRQRLQAIEPLAPVAGNSDRHIRLQSQPLDDAHYQAIKRWCRQRRITPALYFKAIYSLLVKLYCAAEQDMLLFEFHAGRGREFASSIGCHYQRQLLLVDQAATRGSVTALFDYLRRQQKHSDELPPLSLLEQTALLPKGHTSFSYNYLFMPKSGETEGIRFDGISYSPDFEDNIDLRVQIDKGRLTLSLCYQPCLLDENRFIERLLHISEQLLRGVEQLADLDYRLADETLPNSLPALAAPLVHQAITAQAQRTPAAIAVQCGSESLCYGELEARSNALAHALIHRGVQRGDRVGVCLSRRVELLVAILAVIKAGGCYVPMDVSYPAERLAYMLDDCEATLVISEDCMAERLSVVADRLVSVDDVPFADFSTDAPAVAIAPDDLLYMIYTSGSTGLPKGAAAYHKSEANLLGWYVQQYGFTAADRTLIISASGFDLTQKNLFALLTCGGTVVLPDTDHYDVARFVQLIADQQITVINCAPSAFYPLLESGGDNAISALNQLRVLLFGGEPIQLRHLRPWINHPNFATTLVNMYGPTECTDIASHYQLSADQLRNWPDDTPIPLGGPSAGVTLQVLNDQLQAMPPGLVGELYISGNSVGAGYWNRPELTAASFIANPFASGAHDSLLYKTGDRVRWTSDPYGQPVLQYLGRRDFQLKLRGLRIEAGEVEQALNRLAGVIDSHVLVDNEQLIGFVQSDQPLPDNWREALALPEYMVPAQLVIVDEWPLTPNGKIDRKALLQLERPGSTGQYVAPRNDTEQQLAELWQEVLGNPVGIHDNFFAAGGDSLAAVRLVARIELRFATKIPVASLFSAQTIAQLAHVIQQQTGEWSPIVPIQPQGSKTPIFAVHALGAMVLSYQPLAQALGSDQPFYGIQAYGFEDGQQPFTDLAEMVAYYTAAIKQQQPQGPYRLLGHSFGGLIAVEIARQLQAIGDTVEQLVLIDTHMPGRYRERFIDDAMILKTFAEHNFGVVDVPLNALRKLPRDKMVDIVAEQFHGAVSADFIQRAIAIIHGFKTMMKGYRPAPIDVPITLIRPEKAIEGGKGKAIRLVLGDNAHSLGWHKITSQLTLHKSPGDHHSMLKPPEVDALAALVDNTA
ncbi:MAG TPA: amino acid adenylation domain-containing protein [Pseudomonadales bacterium]